MGVPGYYRHQGFTPTERFDVGGWIGQVFEQRLTDPSPGDTP
ncbi:hypothetical protein [Sphaerisporangium flaviroseum]